jgi:CheY-like chemotaxis protein
MPGERILIVEDQVTLMAEPLSALLKRHGYAVVGIGTSHTEAIELYWKEKPDLVILDVMIPLAPRERDDPEGGLKVAAEIRRSGRQTPIVFLTGGDASDSLLRKVAAVAPDAHFLLKGEAQRLDERQFLTQIQLALLRTRDKRSVFVSYAHANAKFKDEMMKHLRGVESAGYECWCDERIAIGSRYRVEIGAAIARADAAIMLISPEYLNSRFIKDFEVDRLLDDRSTRGCTIILVYTTLVDPERLSSKTLGKFQAINRPERPLDAMTPAQRGERVWIPLCGAIRRLQ